MTNAKDNNQSPDSDDRLIEAARHQVHDASDATESLDAVASTTGLQRPTLPESIGRYRIVRKLGEGGMGIVYEAEQQDPRRLVAIKVVRGGAYVDDHHVRLFQREAQSLARLKHPCIATIHEAGRTHEGRHYFAMELVRGVPLHTYATNKQLSAKDRLALFRRICDAVNYAHQRGVIHRDLKPSNILIDADGTPKILDFGLAKITDADVAVTTVETEIGKIQGTLPYMSPEQARGRPDEIDLRSDIYSLGVILYELMAGQLPYDVHRAMLHEAIRIICEEPPQRPSTISRTLRGDIETITLKALEKEPLRRYQSAGALAEDIDRYLTDQPILARRPSTAYQFKKLILRHKIGFGATAAVFVSLLAGLVVSTSMYFQSEANRIKAEQQRERALKTRDFVKKTFIASDARTANSAAPVTMRTVLEDASKRLDEGELSDVPIAEAEMRMWLGGSFRNMGLRDVAKAQFSRALELREELVGPYHSLTIWASHYLSLVVPPEEAEQLARRNIEVLTRNIERTQAHANDSNERARRWLGELLTRRLNAKNVLAHAYMDQNRTEEAEEVLLECIQAFRDRPELAQQYPTGRWLYINGLVNLYWSCCRDDDAKMAEAEGLLRAAISPGPPFADREAIDTLAMILNVRGKYAAAEEILQENFLVRKNVLLPSDIDFVETWSRLITALVGQNKNAEATALFEAYIDDISTSERPGVPLYLNGIAWSVLDCRSSRACAPEFGMKLATRAAEMTDGKHAGILDTLALAYFRTGDTARAIETQEKAVSLLPPGESTLRTNLEANLAKFRAALSDQESALPTEQKRPASTDTEDDSASPSADPVAPATTDPP